ncbi:MAG TPA: hypothetical protein VGN81_05300 [Pseudonocardiaceae bacterium]
MLALIAEMIPADVLVTSARNAVSSSPATPYYDTDPGTTTR